MRRARRGGVARHALLLGAVGPRGGLLLGTEAEDDVEGPLGEHARADDAEAAQQRRRDVRVRLPRRLVMLAVGAVLPGRARGRERRSEKGREGAGRGEKGEFVLIFRCRARLP